MIKNYLKIAWRNLIKNKAHSFINIAGLSVGLACSFLILLWVQNELDMNSFHKNGKNLYQVYERQYYDNKINGQYYTPGLLATEIKRRVPEVAYSTNADLDEWHTFKVADKIISMEGGAADSSFFNMFSYPLLQGTAQNALKDPLDIAISEKMAVAFFGSPQQAMGKTIRLDDRKDLMVTTVFENVGINSSIKFDYLINWQSYLLDNPWAKDWDNNSPLTYLQLRTDADPVAVDRKIRYIEHDLNKNEKQGSFTQELGLQRFDEVYLHSTFVNGKIDGGRIEYVRLFSIVAVFILLIACINFMNLTTARSVKRAKEIGVRKVVGAVRGALIKQFISESLLLTAVAVIFSLLIMAALLPYFNQITQKQIDLPFAQPVFWSKLLLITVITGFISGSYPALYLSSFNPVKVLKGALKLDTGTTLFRKGLVVFQFVLSVVLIIGTIIVSKQVNYIQSINLGYDRDNLVYIPMHGNLVTSYEVFKNEALKIPGVRSVTRMSGSPTDITPSTVGVNWEGKDPNTKVSFSDAAIGYDFMSTLKLKMIAGRDFSKDFGTDSAGYIINETALKRIGYANPIGKPFTLWGNKGTIIGVVKDFHFNSLHQQIKPLVLQYGEKWDGGNVLVSIKAGKTKEALGGYGGACKATESKFFVQLHLLERGI